MHCFVSISYTAGTDAVGKQQKKRLNNITWHSSTASYKNIYAYMILTAVYLHKATDKVCMQTCQSVFYSLPSPCVCVWCRLLLSADTDCLRPMSACLIEALPEWAQDRSKSSRISQHNTGNAAGSGIWIMCVWGVWELRAEPVF